MAMIIGRIFEIVEITPKFAQIVLKKKIDNKMSLCAFSVSGYWRDKALVELALKPKDKIKANFYHKSEKNLERNRYYNDIFFKQIYLVEEAPAPMKSKLLQSNEPDMFSQPAPAAAPARNVVSVDTETGEILM